MGTMTNGFTRLTEQFLVHIGVERGLATATVTAYESDIAKYIDWLETRGIHEPDAITKQDVEDYIAALDQAGESARSKARRLASIHEFHRFALGQHAVTADVSAAVKAPKGASTLPDVLTVDEVTRLLDAAAVGGSTDPVVLRDKALLEFMYATGCRVSEATGANLDDIDLDEHIARLMGKGSKQRLVPLGSYAPRFPRGAHCFSTNAASASRGNRYGKSSKQPGSGPASPNHSIRTPCAIPLPRT